MDIDRPELMLDLGFISGSSVENFCPILCCSDLVSRMIHPLGVTLELRAVEIHISQIARAVTFRLIIEVGRRRIAALAAGGHGFGSHSLAELDDGDKAVAAGPVNLL